MHDEYGLRQRVGEVVHLACTDGHDVEGTLLNVNRRSVWVVDGDDDVLIPWGHIAAVL